FNYFTFGYCYGISGIGFVDKQRWFSKTLSCYKNILNKLFSVFSKIVHFYFSFHNLKIKSRKVSCFKNEFVFLHVPYFCAKLQQQFFAYHNFQSIRQIYLKL